MPKPSEELMYDNILKTWEGLNKWIIDSDEESVVKLLAYEKAGKRRKQFMLRMHSRINKLRADRERIELEQIAK